MPATTGMPCNSHSAVIVEMMITLAPRMKPHSRIKVTIRMAYGFHHANSLIALVMLRCAGNHGASDNHDTPLLTYRRSMVL